MSKNCGSCKKNTVKVQTKMFVLGFYVLSTSIYGTIELIKKIVSLFN